MSGPGFSGEGREVGLARPPGWEGTPWGLVQEEDLEELSVLEDSVEV